MKQQFADYETSKMLKELGFKDECIGFCNIYHDYYNEILFSSEGVCFDNWNKERYLTSIPIWQQVKQWLWEKHKIHIQVEDVSIRIEDGETLEFQGTIVQEGENIDYFDLIISPIEAEIEGIKKAVEYLYKNK